MTALSAATVAAAALPLLAALANGVNALVGGRLHGPVAVSRIAVAGVFGSFVASVWVAAAMIGRDGPHETVLYRWLASGELEVDFAFYVDELTVVMMLVVTAISWLVTRFSVNYMHNEPGFTRYFTVMPLFVFAMLVLVMADNYLLLFLGWEGVGVCSYLLIGFYRHRTSAAQAGTRAFVMNRIGDAGLLLAMFLLVVHAGSLRFDEVFGAADALPPGVQTAVGLLLLVGAIGKSAQLPLGTWLAQAMEGPTPSSALIHAATMVTAGVYLVVRSNPIYDVAPTALLAVGLVGALTAIYGQLVGYVQTDIKGMLAASTTAQLGLMFVLCGLGLYAVAIFHLVAHAFYKSYLFLTAPSILHHLHGGADPAAVAPPARTAPVLAGFVLAAAVALLAVPLLWPGAGPMGNLWVVASLGVVAAFSVLFVTARMVAVGFAGHGREDAAPARRLLAPVLVIAVLAGLGWVAGILPGGVEGTWFHALLVEVAGAGAALSAGHPLMAALFVVALVLLAVSGVLGPRFLDRFRAELPAGATGPLARRLYWRALHRGLLDENYGRLVVGPVAALAGALHRVDRRVLGPVPGVGVAGGRPATAAGSRRPATTAAAAVPADWESRFAAVRSAHQAGFVALAEPPSRLDWLPPATDPHGGGHGRGEWTETAGRVTGAFERATSRWSFERGVDALTTAVARAVEAVERVVFQSRIETVVGALGSGIARFTEAVEHLVFQSGVERGLRRAGTATQRSLLSVENWLGRPPVMVGLLVLVLGALVVGSL